MLLQKKSKIEFIVAELIFYDGTQEAQQLLLSNHNRLYRPQHLSHSLYPFLKKYGPGNLVDVSQQRVSYIKQHSTIFMRDGTRQANNYLMRGMKK